MHIPLSQRDIRDYGASLYRSILDLASRKKPSGIARDISKTIELTSDALSDEELYVQLDGLRTTRELNHRSLSAGTQNLGGYLIGTELSAVEETLRPASVLLQAGARIVQLQGNMALRREMTAATAQWLHETDQVTEQTERFGQLTLSPHRCSAFLTLSRQMQHQVDPDASDLLVASMRRSVGVALDKGGLTGSGIAGEPQGVTNTSGVSSVTFGGAATWTKILQFESKIAQANGDDTLVSFVGHPSVREKWRSVQRFSSAGNATLWNSDDDHVGTHPAYVTTNLGATQILAGDFTKMLIGLWGAARVTIDPYTNMQAEKIEITVTQMADIGAIWPLVFCVPTDSAVQ